MSDIGTESLQEGIDLNRKLEEMQYGERRFGKVEIVGDCAFSSSLAVLVRKNRPPIKNYSGNFLADQLSKDAMLKVTGPNFFSKVKVTRIGLRSEPEGYAIALPFTVRWRTEVKDDLLQYVPVVIPAYGGLDDKNINHKNSEVFKERIIQCLNLKRKTLEPSIVVLPTAPWDSMYPEDLSEYVIEIDPVPFACFRTEARKIIEPYIKQVNEAMEHNSPLPNSPWFTPSHQGIYSSPLEFKPTSTQDYSREEIDLHTAKLQEIVNNCITL